MQDRLNWIASRLTLFGGLIQLLCSLSLLFLPVFVTCDLNGGNSVCYGKSYLQLGGNTLGYIFIVGMMGIGVLAIVSSQDRNDRRAFLSRWLFVAAGAVVVVVAGFGFGIVFAPGTLILLLAALLTRIDSTPSL
jgi:hypothetical protein